MVVDFALAVLHHLLVFSLVGIFFAEAVLVHRGLSGALIGRLARLDMIYGIVSILVIAVGVLRVFYSLKGWDYYAGNHSFWGKMLAFGVVGILSIWPSRIFNRWRKMQRSDPGFVIPESELVTVRRFVHAEAFAFVFILVFAAAMARGIGA